MTDELRNSWIKQLSETHDAFDEVTLSDKDAKELLSLLKPTESADSEVSFTKKQPVNIFTEEEISFIVYAIGEFNTSFIQIQESVLKKAKKLRDSL